MGGATSQDTKGDSGEVTDWRDALEFVGWGFAVLAPLMKVQYMLGRRSDCQWRVERDGGYVIVWRE